MMSHQRSKIEALAYMLYRGSDPQPGQEITWCTPSAYRTEDTVQHRETVTAAEIAKARTVADEAAK